MLLSDPSGLTISQYAGPELPFTIKDDPLSADRRRYQITNDSGLLTTLSAREWAALGEFFGWDCSPECEGPHLHCDIFCNHPGKEPLDA